LAVTNVLNRYITTIMMHEQNITNRGAKRFGTLEDIVLKPVWQIAILPWNQGAPACNKSASVEIYAIQFEHRTIDIAPHPTKTKIVYYSLNRIREGEQLRLLTERNGCTSTIQQQLALAEHKHPTFRT